MSVRSLWKARAAERMQQPKEEWVPSPLAGKQFETILHDMKEAFKARMPQMADAVDDPNSNIHALLSSVAAVDADLWKQAEAIAGFIETKGVKLK